MAAKRKYNWEEWFSRPRTLLTRGVDYHCSQAMMWQTVKMNASRLKIKVRVTDIHEGILIEVLSAIPHPDPTPVAG